MTCPHCGVYGFCTALGLVHGVPYGTSGTHSGCHFHGSVTVCQVLTGWYPVVSE